MEVILLDHPQSSGAGKMAPTHWQWHPNEVHISPSIPLAIYGLLPCLASSHPWRSVLLALQSGLFSNAIWGICICNALFGYMCALCIICSANQFWVSEEAWSREMVLPWPWYCTWRIYNWGKVPNPLDYDANYSCVCFQSNANVNLFVYLSHAWTDSSVVVYGRNPMPTLITSLLLPNNCRYFLLSSHHIIPQSVMDYSACN